MVYTIMASYLEEYSGCAKNREEKFVRAVDSFLANTYEDKKLIIVADGCKKTEALYKEKYSTNPKVIFLFIEKQVAWFSGQVRNAGLNYAKKDGKPEDIVCYLDTDDRFGEDHIKKLIENWGDNEFVIFDTHRYSSQGWHISAVTMARAQIGTSSFAHKLGLDITWPDGYGHDWYLLETISQKYKYSKIPMPDYYVHHVPDADC